MKRVMMPLAVLVVHVNVMELVHVLHNLDVLMNVLADKQNVRELKVKLAFNLVHAGYGVLLQIVSLVRFVAVQELQDLANRQHVHQLRIVVPHRNVKHIIVIILEHVPHHVLYLMLRLVHHAHHVQVFLVHVV